MGSTFQRLGKALGSGAGYSLYSGNLQPGFRVGWGLRAGPKRPRPGAEPGLPVGGWGGPATSKALALPLEEGKRVVTRCRHLLLLHLHL